MISINEIKKYEQDIIDFRRDIHMYPETGFEEVRTSEKVAKLLEEYGIEVVRNIAKTGVIGILKGISEGKTIALRADMDALNMPEECELEYKSKIDGKMHGCGHDTHTAMLLGAAKVLSENRDKINGTVKFVFQPAEEGPKPGGGTLVMESGILDDVDAIYAIHVNPLFETGMIEINQNEAMASTDFFRIVLKGKGTHASAPHTGIDPIMMSSQVLAAFQNIISRELDPVDPAVLSVCTINGGSTFNVIPENVTLTGTVRTLNEEVREKVFDRMENIVKSITDMYNGSYEFQREKAYPPTINHENMVEFAVDVCKEIVGNERVIKLKKPNMGGEDFAYYLKKIPGALMWLGCGNKEKGSTAMLHNSKFVMDEDALIIGTAVHVNLVLGYLNSKTK
ncbi:amidohydrolase [uncultured Clostridium sp.]|uniref:M20 metallopeptidase family protein n=1 Tax=uncultured Clostridium sp. TaxID=59620 RepID=UPI0032167F8A